VNQSTIEVSTFFEMLTSAPDRVAEAVASLPDKAHHWQPGPEDWSIHQHITHLSRADAPFLARLNRMMKEANPWLPYFGPEVARPDSTDPLSDVLAHFRGERDQLVAFLTQLSPADWERPGVHETLGPTTIALQIQNIANHDAEHLQQVYDLRRAWENQTHA
jgi:hypothetical protein